MSDAPLLSFCVFTYNRALLLTQVLDQMAAVKRAFEAGVIEVVVSDNCSTDNTVPLITERYSADGFKIIVQSKNVRASRNWLDVIKKSSGTYVWPFADDDLIDVDGVIDFVQTHLRHDTAEFYRTNFVQGHYAEVPRRLATTTQISHCLNCDIIFPDMTSLIPHCGIMARGLVMSGNIFRADRVRHYNIDHFLPLDEATDQVEILLRAFRTGRCALLHRCLMTVLTPAIAPRWFSDMPPGMPGNYVFTIGLMRRMVRMIENGTIEPSLIDVDGLLITYKLADDYYITVRYRLPHYLFHETLNLLVQYDRPMAAHDSAAIGAFGHYLADPALKMLFQQLERFSETADLALLAHLHGLRDVVMQDGRCLTWRTRRCPAYEAHVGRDVDLSSLGGVDVMAAA